MFVIEKTENCITFVGFCFFIKLISYMYIYIYSKGTIKKFSLWMVGDFCFACFDPSA